MMARPAFNVTSSSANVHGGQAAQKWSCSDAACRGGVYQTVATTPGATCEVGAYVQSLSTNGTGTTSDLTTADDRDNSTWFVRVNLTGGTGAFANGLQISRGFGYNDKTYDRFGLIKYTFQATGNRTTVYFENLRLWPLAKNVSTIDDAYLRCTQ